MSLTLAALLTVGAAAPAAAPACAWDRPGHDPFMGDVVAAVDHYPDIPAPARARLKARMASRAYDEIVSIRRDAIVGRARYQPEIRGMHFGAGQVCGTVSRAKWTAASEERGLVYCEDGHCILVPTVCRNVSRITRDGPAVAGAADDAPGGGGGAGGAGGSPGGLAGLPPAGEAAAPAGEAAAPTSFVSGLTPPAQTASALGSVGGESGAGAAPLAWMYVAGGQSALGGGGGGGYGGLPGGGLPDGGLPELPAPPAVPEPGRWALLIAGLAALGWRARRRS